MKRIKEYKCDGRTPTDKELLMSIKIASDDNCIVKLNWFFPYTGNYSIEISSDMTLDMCKERLPKFYPL